MSVTKGAKTPAQINITLKEFKKLAELHCTLAEMASFFDCSDDTVERWCKKELGMGFAEAFKRYSGNGKISLRRSQWLQATDKQNVSMLIWLGKQYLNQKDIVEHTGDAAKPVTLAYAKPLKKKIDELIEQDEKDANGE